MEWLFNSKNYDAEAIWPIKLLHGHKAVRKTASSYDPNKRYQMTESHRKRIYKYGVFTGYIRGFYSFSVLSAFRWLSVGA